MSIASGLQCASVTHVGMKRSQNQDNYASEKDIGLFLIADGMGGHRGGETASQIAVETVSRLVRNARKQQEFRAPLALQEALCTANDAIFDRSSKDDNLHGMGTTSTALLFHGGRAWLGHVGDSRCYMVKKGAIWQLTRDHSLVQEKLRAGLITRDEVRTDRMKNVITRSVGFERDLSVELYEITQVEADDIFILCSDGLSGLVEDHQILSTVLTFLTPEPDSLQAVAQALVNAANQNGGDDNVTVIVVRATSK